MNICRIHAEELDHFIDFPKPSENSSEKLICQWAMSRGAKLYTITRHKRTIMRFSLTPSLKNTDTLYLGHVQIQDAMLDKKRDDFFNSFLQDYMQKNHKKKCIGPIDFYTWFNYRVCMEPASYSFDPTYSTFYLQWFNAQEFNASAHYKTVSFRLINILGHYLGCRLVSKSYKRLHELGYSLKPMNEWEKTLPELIEEIYTLTLNNFHTAYCFEPMDKETFILLYSSMLKKYDYSPSFLLYSPAGSIEGFLFAYREHNQCIIKTVAINTAERVSHKVLFTRPF
jgi:hypothetical protein